MRKTIKLILCLLGIMLMIFGLTACGKQKYKLNLDPGFDKPKKTSYAAGETVTVYLSLIATDTDYSFYLDSDDVKLSQSYEDKHGYVLSFTMPEHDVTLHYDAKNSMVYDPEASEAEAEYNLSIPPETYADYITNDQMQFEYYERQYVDENTTEYVDFCLYECDNNSAYILARYTKHGSEKEHLSYRLVPNSVIDDCYDCTVEYEMDKWGTGQALEGAVYVVKFYKLGNILRVSSESMPENGMEAFDTIGNIIKNAWASEGAIYDAY
ncbi:MAG: hypothetical protein K6G12_09585 [Lachnospiraceae bacterium]|nr:hypothetical protein [Lachnospiraceae bacterium]